MNDKVKEILNEITVNGMRELTESRLTNAIFWICELQKTESASEIKDINYECWVKIVNSKNVAE